MWEDTIFYTKQIKQSLLLKRKVGSEGFFWYSESYHIILSAVFGNSQIIILPVELLMVKKICIFCIQKIILE